MLIDEEKLTKFVKSGIFCLITMLLGAFFGWQPIILLILALLYTKENLK